MDWNPLLKDAPAIIVLILLVGTNLKLILALTSKFLVNLMTLDQRQGEREKITSDAIIEQSKCIQSLERKTVAETKALERLAEEVKDTKYALKELRDVIRNIQSN